MINVAPYLIDAWFDVLDGNLTYAGDPVKVYKGGGADNFDRFHKVLISSESESDNSNKTSDVSKPIITLDVVTYHPVTIDYQIVEDIYNQVVGLVFVGKQCMLRTSGNIQILNVKNLNSTTLDFNDGTRKLHRKVTRFFHRVNQF